jgi:hypothetical protein
MRNVIIALIVMQLTGCATTQVGNYAETSITANQVMAKDTVKELTVLYPPAKTRLQITQPIKDAYGIALIQALRAKGYSVVESTELKKDNNLANQFSYVVDSPIKNTLYRVTVGLGNQSISRAYASNNGVLMAAGNWARKE